MLSTVIDSSNRVLQYQDDGRVAAQLFCESKGFKTYAFFDIFESFGLTWPAGTTNLNFTEFWTGEKADAYKYIICAPIQDDDIDIVDSLGNIGHDNVRVCLFR